MWPVRLQVSAKSGEGVEAGFLAVVTAAAKRVKEEEPIIPDTLKVRRTVTHTHTTRTFQRITLRSVYVHVHRRGLCRRHAA